MAPEPFPNTGNICYFNALLQCILAAVGRARLINRPGSTNLVMIEEMVIRTGKPLSASPESASEYYSLFLDAFQAEKKFCQRFHCTANKSVSCLAGDHRSTTHEEPYNIFSIANGPVFKNVGDPTFEIVADRQCSLCGSSTTITTIFPRLPDVVVIEIKRGDGAANIVPIPDAFGNHQIRGTVHHLGGHYAASVVRDGRWWIADDATITEGRLPIASATMCFYSRIAPR